MNALVRERLNEHTRLGTSGSLRRGDGDNMLASCSCTKKSNWESRYVSAIIRCFHHKGSISRADPCSMDSLWLKPPYLTGT